MADLDTRQPHDGIFYEGPEMYSMVAAIKSSSCTPKILLWNKIGNFVYTNRMNRLFLEGVIEYDDTDGAVARLTEYPDCRCDVTISHYSQSNKEGDLGGQPKLDSTLELHFIVDGIDRPENESNLSRIHLKSENYYRQFRNVDFSSYGKPTSVTDIIKDILVNTGEYKIDGESFDDKSNTQIEFITKQNDRIVSVVNRMLNKQILNYPYDMKCDSLKSLIYDERVNNIVLFDVGKKQYTGMHTPVPINLFKNIKDEPELFKKINGQDNNIGYLSYKPRSSVVMSSISKNMYTYSIETNKFDDTKKLSQLQQNDIMNGPDNMNPKFNYKIDEDDSHYNQYISQCDDEENYYNELFGNITSSVGITVNTIGNLGVIPGCECTVKVQKSTREQNNADGINTEVDKMMFQDFSGKWTASAIDHIMSPTGNYFRQRLELYRVEKEF